MRHSVVIVGINSGIGSELASRYSALGWQVFGTFRKNPPINVDRENCCECNIVEKASILQCVEFFEKKNVRWSRLIIASGTEEPIGNFMDCDPDEWESGISVNVLSPLRLLRGLYKLRADDEKTSVIFFSGSGTNNAVANYSAYCASKLMLIKMCELLDAECEKCSFTIVGPGIVRTKIHQQTLDAGPAALANYKKVVDFLSSENAGTQHDEIYECIEWCCTQPKEVIGGRNISLVHDQWRAGGHDLAASLKNDQDMYKMRRNKN